MDRFQPALSWIDTQADRARQLVTRWANINSGSAHLAGLAAQAVELKKEFAVLNADLLEVDVKPLQTVAENGATVETPLGRLLAIRKRSESNRSESNRLELNRPESKCRVLLVIHYDTVYDEAHPFQKVDAIDDHTLRGPGVADAKGGIAVLLLAVQALERSAYASNLAWEIVLNPDEELGSPGSADFLRQAARRNDLGLVYEPALPDGSLVGDRKGSGNFNAVVRGRSAHAGRDFHQGRNAVHAAAKLIVAIDDLNGQIPGATFNVGKVDGGGPSNVVPDLAICRFNVRIVRSEDEALVMNLLHAACARIDLEDGISVELSGGFLSPPRPMDAKTTALYESVAICGRQLGMPLRWSGSGGVSDANKLAAAGLPVIDTLGPVGGKIHSNEEYVVLESLIERAKLSALFLMKLAAGEIEMPGRN